MDQTMWVENLWNWCYTLCLCTHDGIKEHPFLYLVFTEPLWFFNMFLARFKMLAECSAHGWTFCYWFAILCRIQIDSLVFITSSRWKALRATKFADRKMFYFETWASLCAIKLIFFSRFALSVSASVWRAIKQNKISNSNGFRKFWVWAHSLF